MQHNELVQKLISPSISLPFTEPQETAIDIARKKLTKITKQFTDASFYIYRRSVDARTRGSIKLVYSVLVELPKPIKCKKEALQKEGFRICPIDIIDVRKGSEAMRGRPLVVGSGPAGMFCALMLAEQGYRPILIERGAPVELRVRDVDAFFDGGALNTESNVMFGAGGAGTFSDGKLVTRINDPLCNYVLKKLCDNGAPREILISAKPHIGTDKLRGVVSSLLSSVEALGGEVIYNCRLDSIVERDDGSLCAITSLGDIECGAIVLATGHSARDTFGHLLDSGYSIISKPFSVGVRIEHLRSDIEYALYGKYAGDLRLGAAEYALSDTTGERGVYTFCMCPGGQVVACSSEDGGLVVNGMSHYARDGINSNSAIAVSIGNADHDGTPMGAIEFQRSLEKRAFVLGGGNYSAPVETVGDFLAGKVASFATPSRIMPTYTRNETRVSDISSIFPSSVSESLKRGIVSFGKKIQGFDAPDSVLTAVESRTSSPIRIMRDAFGVAPSHSLIYPCGEGAGYAGGITSAAVDGTKTALSIINRFAPFSAK
jgi:uncharacterized FAD-dependent dehydrogenase